MIDLPQRDQRVTWHPYTQHGVERAPLPVARAEGAWLELSDGRRLLDAISSWWATLHGHCEPELVAAMHAQAGRLDHVLFAGATHEPAVQLAEMLLEVVPEGLSRVFYSDDGSTAVEAGMKMVLQSWVHRGEPERRVFIALEGAYHGDTFGAMAAGDPDPFFTAFTPLLFEVRRVPADADQLSDALDALGGRAAGFLLEPLLQGAAGMRVMSEEFVRAARELCTEHGVPLIADEVMTGFGRTGELFACGRSGIAPDVLCLAKGLTGGMLPLSATVATEELFECFLHRERSRFFPHGHTYTANPIACAVGVESLRLCRDRDVPGKLEAIGRAVFDELAPLRGDPRVCDVRQLGGMAALDLAVSEEDAGYLSERAPELRRKAVERGVLLRPLGNVLYALPPACTTLKEARAIGATMRALVEDLD